MLPLAFSILGAITTVVARHDAFSSLIASGDEANPFDANLKLNIPKYDEALQRHLWHGIRSDESSRVREKKTVFTYSIRSEVSKRAMGQYGPLITIPCLFCENKRTDGPLSLSEFTKEKMYDRIIPRGKIGACLFYGQRKKGSIPPRLSDAATEYACLTGVKYKTIWQLWAADRITNPKPDENNFQSCWKGTNYYCLDYSNPKCCWLNPLLGTSQPQWKDNGMAYFRAMSRAMAMTCSGKIYILTDNPDEVMDQIPDYADTPSIWINDEVEEMRPLYAGGRITAAIALTYSPLMLFPTEKDVTSRVFGDRNIKRSPDEVRKVAAALAMQKQMAAKNAKAIMAGAFDLPGSNNGTEKRALGCTNANREENPDLDYFG